MAYLSQIFFVLTVLVFGYFFIRRVIRIKKNIQLGRKVNRNDQPGKRLRKMLLVAFGQQKMFKKIIPAVLHLFIYVGFLVINLEVLEFVIDGLFGTHRIFAAYLGGFYTFCLNFFELLALAVVFSCVVFLIRRNVLKLPRFWNTEMTSWPRLDANLILLIEILLMAAIFTMNATDQILQSRDTAYTATGKFFLSAQLIPVFEGASTATLIILERLAWWVHIIGILAFAVYITYSKHLHIFMAFPNTYFANLNPPGQMDNMPEVTNEVKIMLGTAAADQNANETTARFGAKDVTDLTRFNIMNAYACTECGRCTAECPANITGKALSPRKIMMDVRDRVEEIGLSSNHGQDNKSLLGDYITREEIFACTSCNACVEACPVEIDPLSIILQLKRYTAMEESSSPSEWNNMFSNIETNFAPWKFPATDRFNWINSNQVPTLAEMSAIGKHPEVLFWVGCAGSYDQRYQKVTRALVKILHELNISFAVLGQEESCTGDPARRAGNEFLFQMQAMANIEILNGYEVHTIVTACPHCFNTLKNEYPDLGGNYDVIHHSTFLQRLIDEGRLVVKGGSNFNGKTITYHDSCFLGRANGIYEAPRKVLEALDAELVEMKRCGASGLCCGAGGAQMFKEPESGNKDINTERTEEALSTGASIIASACPFCMTMLSDGVKGHEKEDEVEVMDLAELIARGKGL